MIMKRRSSKSFVVLTAALFVLGLASWDRARIGVSSVLSAHAKDKDDENDRCPRSCSNETLEGCYGTEITGSIVAFGPVGPVADVGVLTFDGDGNVSQVSTVSLNGTILQGRASTGTYVVNPDCTGSLALHLPPPAGESSLNFVIVNKGKELNLINTGNGRVLAGVAKRQ
jgi:hypothetical protein